MSFPFRTVMFVSLAVNLLIAGAAIGGSAAGLRLERAPVRNAVVERMPGPRAFMLALPPEAREKMRAELTQAVPETRQAREAARQSRVDVYNAVRQEPYDAERVRAAFAHMRQADAQVLAIFHDHAARAFAELTPDQRAQALDALRHAQPQAQQTQTQQQGLDGQGGGAPDAPLSAGQGSGANTGANNGPNNGPDAPWRQRMRERRQQRLLERQQQNGQTGAATATTTP
jgi:uncharacterized membrane protein